MADAYWNIIFYKRYFTDFVDKQSLKVAKKIYWTIDVIRQNRLFTEPYVKSLEGTNGLSEIRVMFGGDIFRIFCFFDEGKLIVLAHGFQKKSDKTPRKEIEKAMRIKDEYYAEKEKH